MNNNEQKKAAIVIASCTRHDIAKNRNKALNSTMSKENVTIIHNDSQRPKPLTGECESPACKLRIIMCDDYIFPTYCSLVVQLQCLHHNMLHTYEETVMALLLSHGSTPMTRPPQFHHQCAPSVEILDYVVNISSSSTACSALCIHSSRNTPTEASKH